MGTQFYNDSEPVNWEQAKEISIRNLIELICDLMKFEVKLSGKRISRMGNPRRCLDIERAEQAFDFTAEVGFKEGLENTITGIENTLPDQNRLT
jgi:GDP-L-fucose synthase